MLRSLEGYDVVYLSAITLSIYTANRERLMAALRRAREGGVRIVFDTNFRARLWPDLEVARRVYRETFDAADIVLASTEDFLPLYPDQTNESMTARIASPEIVLKLPNPKACCVSRVLFSMSKPSR